MDKFHFDTPTCRRGTRSYKYDSADAQGTEIGLWVADMDFEVAPAIAEAVQRRAQHPVYGYVTVQDDYRQAAADWYRTQHGWTIPTDYIEAIPGVVPAITALLRARAQVGPVCFFTPAYNCFFSSARHAGIEAIEMPLLLQDRHYEIDWALLEATLRRAKTLLLCNPHNPTGRVWTREELTRIAALCIEHDVMVIADEIHCEFAWGRSYCPWAVVVESQKSKVESHYIVLNSASKAWNIAGLRQANAIACDEQMHDWLYQVIVENELEDMNIFGVEATIAAYRHGEEWLRCVNRYIMANYQWLVAYMAEHAPAAPVIRMEGTYLAWVDCRALPHSTQEITHRILTETGVKINDGAMYGGDGFVRINLALSRTMLEKAMLLATPYFAA